MSVCVCVCVCVCVRVRVRARMRERERERERTTLVHEAIDEVQRILFRSSRTPRTKEQFKETNKTPNIKCKHC